MSCYGCKCNFCARSCELYSEYVTIGEVDDCCFNCDECREFDGDHRKRWRFRQECEEFIEAQKYTEARAAAMRRNLQVIKGGKG
jgi:hypothetical protein